MPRIARSHAVVVALAVALLLAALLVRGHVTVGGLLFELPPL